jgi:hypothetical protein
MHILKSKKSLFSEVIANFGIDNFDFIELCTANSKEELDNLEISYIKERNTLSLNGYNISKGGNRWAWRNKELSAKRLSDVIKGRPMTWSDKIIKNGDEHWTRKKGYNQKAINAMRITNIGTKRDEDFRRKCSQRLKENPITKEDRKK